MRQWRESTNTYQKLVGFFFFSLIYLFSTGGCLLIATYIINRLPSKVLGFKSPYEVLFGKIPSYASLRCFSCLFYASTPTHLRSKLNPRATKCVFIGYPFNQKGYKLLDLIHIRFLFPGMSSYMRISILFPPYPPLLTSSLPLSHLFCLVILIPLLTLHIHTLIFLLPLLLLPLIPLTTPSQLQAPHLPPVLPYLRPPLLPPLPPLCQSSLLPGIFLLLLPLDHIVLYFNSEIQTE